MALFFEELCLDPTRTKKESRARARRSAFRRIRAIFGILFALAAGGAMAEKYSNPFSNYVEDANL